MIRVALIDDHPLILKIVRQELMRSTDLEIIWDANDSSQVMSLVAANPPRVLVLALSFARRAFDPVTAGHAPAAPFPPTLTLILNATNDPAHVHDVCRARGHRYCRTVRG